MEVTELPVRGGQIENFSFNSAKRCTDSKMKGKECLSFSKQKLEVFEGLQKSPVTEHLAQRKTKGKVISNGGRNPFLKVS